MDVKVYKKEEVKQPSGTEYVYVPDVIDIIPELVEAETTTDIRNNIWSLEKLKRVADVEVKDNKLIIKSDNVRFEDGKLLVRVTEEQLYNAEILEDDSRELLEQECALATIWQKGLDPLDKDEGIRWSEAMLEEINCVQLMQDITEAVSNVSTSVHVTFSTVDDGKGNSFLSYKLSEVL